MKQMRFVSVSYMKENHHLVSLFLDTKLHLKANEIFSNLKLKGNNEIIK